jgi:sigma-E factor negative regulatory protein RseA
MSEANREILSAGMDGELSREELRFLLRRLEADATSADAWGRFHLAGEALRRQAPPPVSRDFASRVMAAIDAEAATVAPAAPRRRWLHWSAGGAIAASVAVAALMVAQPANHPQGVADTGQQVAATQDDAPQVAAAQPSQPPVAPQWLSGNIASQFTQKAAFDGSGSAAAAYLPRSTPYQIQRIPSNDSADGGYLLLVRPDGSRYVQPVAAPQGR